MTVAMVALLGSGLLWGVAALLRRRLARVRWRVIRDRTEAGPARSTVDVLRGALRDAPVAGPAMVAVVGGLLGYVAAGPVVAVVAATYAWLGTHAMRRRLARQRATADRAAIVEAAAGLAADLRAGLTPARALAPVASVRAAAVEAGGESALVAGRIGAAVRVAEECGAPLAGVLDRLEQDLRSLRRVRAIAAAQTAGARASATLLAALPVAGLGLGVLIGVDPRPVLLHTPIGAVAVLVAVALQVAGLLWSARLARVEVPS